MMWVGFDGTCIESVEYFAILRVPNDSFGVLCIPEFFGNNFICKSDIGFFGVQQVSALHIRTAPEAVACLVCAIAGTSEWGVLTNSPLLQQSG